MNYCNFLYTVLLLGGTLITPALAQPQGMENDTLGIKIIQDSRIDDLIKKHININDQFEGMPGFRVQIFFGSKAKKALEVKADFIETHSDIEGYVIYDVPYFKVRVGDFRTHLEAQKLHKEIMEEFPGSFIVKDMIPIPGKD